MLTILQDSSPNYKNRTEINVKNSDLTIAFAVDFTTLGEKLTKGLCFKHKKKFIAINPKEKVSISETIELINSFDVNNIRLNIAGNGIYTLIKYGITQEKINDYIYKFLKTLVENEKSKFKIISIRSGGQTGFDLASVLASYKLGIDTIVLYPYGYKIRKENGIDINQNYEDVLKLFS